MSESPLPIARPAATGRARRIALVVLALAGCLISGVLVRMSLPAAGPATLLGARLCAPGEHVDCAYVLGSRWAKIGPIPTAVFGFLYFAVLAAWFLLVGLPNADGRAWHLFPLILTTLGFCASLWLVYVMAGLPVWCTWCLAAHLTNGLLFVLTILSRPRGPAAGVRAYPSPARAGMVLGGSAAAALILLLLFLGLLQQYVARQFQLRYLDATNNIDYIAWRHSREARHEIPLRPDDPCVGAAGATATLVVFTDFECPRCASFHVAVRRLVSRFPENLRCVFKHFPLSRRCNRHVDPSLHRFACEAAFAAEAARACGTPEQVGVYHKLLYRNSRRFDERPYRRLAEAAGIDGDLFSTALSSEAVRRRVEEDVELGHRLGVDATPALFLNGRRLPGWQIVTRTARPRMDADETLRLWEELLGATARAHRSDGEAAQGGGAAAADHSR